MPRSSTIELWELYLNHSQQFIDDMRAESREFIDAIRAESQKFIDEMRAESREFIDEIRAESQQSTRKFIDEIQTLILEIRAILRPDSVRTISIDQKIAHVG